MFVPGKYNEAVVVSAARAPAQENSQSVRETELLSLCIRNNQFICFPLNLLTNNADTIFYLPKSKYSQIDAELKLTPSIPVEIDKGPKTQATAYSSYSSAKEKISKTEIGAKY